MFLCSVTNQQNQSSAISVMGERTWFPARADATAHTICVVLE